MNITIINGSPRKGNTYTATHKFISEMQKYGEVNFEEFFLPKDLPEHCHGCFNCILKDEKLCPHSDYVQPILNSMVKADGLIFNTPVYVMSCSGGMKAFLDHFGFMFLIHRARPEMFHKKAFILSTTAGAGTKPAMKTIETVLRYWGVNRVYKRGFTLHSLKWDNMDRNKKDKYEKHLQKDAEKFYKSVSSKKDRIPYFNTRFIFFMVKQFQKRADDSSVDKQYFKKQGWFDGNSPFNS